MDIDPRLPIALSFAVGVGTLTAGVLRLHLRRQMQHRVRWLAQAWDASASAGSRARNVTANMLAGRLGARLGQRLPGQVRSLSARMEGAGLGAGVSTVELLGWKAVCVSLGAAIGIWGLVSFGAVGLFFLAAGLSIGWFGIDLVLARGHSQRRQQILRDLPTVMDLLVLSLEAGMGLDRAMRTVSHDYRCALSEELERVLRDVDLGTGRGDAFERMAARVGLDDLRAVSRAIVQSEELGVSLVGVMQTQSREVRLSRRRYAEAAALRAPIKMIIPLVIFILPTLFMLLLGPVGLRAGDAMGKMPTIP